MKQVKIGILGLGTVGCGAVNILNRNSAEIKRRIAHDISIVQAAVRNLDVERDCDTTNIEITADVMSIVNNPEIDIVVELIGGTSLAYEAVKQAIKNGKHVVTANKALIAIHGTEILKLAIDNNVNIAFEAAVAGGIPIIKSIREGLAANNIQWLAGIINGTGNFILTEMRDKKRDFNDVLKEAQDLGYAESDPTFDIEGIDAAHKLTILASISFGIPLQFDKVFTEGISKIETQDVELASELGYSIKHLGIAKQKDNGIELRVHPTLIPKNQILANVNGVMNAVLVMSDSVGPTLYYGPGAGSEPTASAVIADIIDVVRSMGREQINQVPALAFQDNSLVNTKILDITQIKSSYYIRAKVTDKAGVLAKITTILAEKNISIEAFIQKDSQDKQTSIVLLTHLCLEQDMVNAINEIEKLSEVIDKLIKIRADSLS